VFFSAIPFLNILVFLKLINDLFYRFRKKENKSKYSNYNKKTFKKYPHLNTFNMLKEIKKMY
jgi:hypothetical protein